MRIPLDSIRVAELHEDNMIGNNVCFDPFDEMASGLDEIGTGIGVNIKCQREEIFTKMHRI